MSHIESELLESLIENYRLSEKEHKTILEELQMLIFSNKTYNKNPYAMFVIGQPGCGKTTFIQNTDFSNYTIINSDDYRQFSRYSDEILSKYPTYYAKLTNLDAHLWGDELFSFGLDNGYSVLREKAPVDDSLLEPIKAILSHYHLVINVVVTGNLESLLATRERYETDISKSQNAKLSNIESHNKCYNLLPDFISNCLCFGAKVNYVVAVHNEFQITPVGDDCLNLLEKLRAENNKQACLNYETRMNNIKQKMISRNAPKEQFEELNKIENIYFEIVKSKNLENSKVEE